MDQETRMSVIDGEPFTADEVSIIHNPLRIVMDFKSITPRVDVLQQPMRLNMKHNVVVLEPFLAKQLFSVLKKNLDQFEKKFGKITESDNVKKAKKTLKKKKGKEKPVQQSYFG